MDSLNASNLFRTLVGLNKSINGEYLAMGLVLKNLKENSRWRESVGDGGIETWDDFLKQPEIGISRLEADRMMKAYSVLVEEKGYSIEDLKNIPVASIKRLIEIDIDDNVIEQAKTLTTKDFKEAIAENNNIQERTYTYMVMRRCKETGNMTKVHGITSEEIKGTFNLE